MPFKQLWIIVDTASSSAVGLRMRVRSGLRRILPVVAGAAACSLAVVSARADFAGALGPEQAAILEVLQIDFTTTHRASRQGWIDVETERGTYFIVQDGRYRIDTLYPESGERFAEIFNLSTREKIKLNLDEKWGVAGSTASPWIIPNPRGKALPLPGGPPAGARTESSIVNIGTKHVSGIVLEGVRDTVNISQDGEAFTHVIEMWGYRFADRKLPPILIEKSFSAPDETSHRRITHVTLAQVHTDLFSVPDGFAMTVVKP